MDPIRERGWVPPMELDPNRFGSSSTESADPVDNGAGAELGLGEEPAAAGGARASGIAGAVGGAARMAWPRRWRVGTWLALALAALVLVAVGFDTANLVNRSFAANPALGILVSLLVAVAGGAAIKMVVDELLSLKRLRQIEGLRAEADRLTAEGKHGHAEHFTECLEHLYQGRDDLLPVLGGLKAVITDAHNDGEVVQLIDRELLTVIDRSAYQRVVRASRDTALATALSPAAVIDVAVVLWRNLKLVREIAVLYGARPGYIGSARLLRRMLANLAIAGVTESAGHLAIEALGGSLAAAISTRIGQGMINGLLTARVGVTAMHLCRPVAFGPTNRPSLGRIRRELLSLPKQVL
jgi:putative membrane protein